MKRFFFLFFTFFTLFSRPFQALANPDTKVDSLRNALRLAKHDSTKVRIKFELGAATGINRVSYWDSLAHEVGRYPMPLLECWIYNMLGVFQRIGGQDEKAIESLTRCVSLAEKSGNKSAALNPLLNLSDYYIQKNEIKTALNYCFKALKIAEQINNKKKIAEIYSLIALSYYYTGDLQKALKTNLMCLKIYKELKDDMRIASALLDVGNSYIQLHDNTTGNKYYMECKKYSDAFGESHLAIEINNSIGVSYLWAKQLDSASKYCNKANAMARKMNSKQAIGSTLAILAKISLEKNDLSTAKKLVLEALDVSKEAQFILQIPDLAKTLKEIYLKEKNYKGALEAYELYVSTGDSLSNETTRKLTSEKEFAHNLEKKENENKLLSQQNMIQLLEIKQKNYFVTGLAALFVLLLIITYLFTRQSKLKNEQKHAQLEQKLLLSQMNPHFIFNSLQAIQNFILKHNEQEAVKYLSSFASITRNVLENSRMELIPLKKEISLLENYLQLQQLRFKNRFDYSIELDEAIDIDNTLLPPMMAQPFIENAVEHGFHNLENEGNIRISYSLKNGELLMEIIDNGPGMKDGYAATKKHQSLAMEITRERILLMNKKSKDKKAVFTITEAFPARERKGVKIQFHLPLILQY